MTTRKKAPTLPPLPKWLYSVLGRLPVRQDPELHATNEEAGHINFLEREIVIDSNFKPVSKWHTFGHEAMHLILSDAGVVTGITDDHEERICDAFGTWFAAAVRAGYLVVDDTKA